MRIFLCLLFLLMGMGSVSAQSAAVVGRELRAVELGQQALERDAWIHEARIFYFDDTDIDISLGEGVRKELIDATDSYRKRFLTEREVQGLCRNLRKIVDTKIGPLKVEICEITTDLLRFKVGP